MQGGHTAFQQLYISNPTPFQGEEVYIGSLFKEEALKFLQKSFT
jgi:hypothetical protein